jgi:hypothetical protein
MKKATILSSLAMLLVSANAALAEPITYYGSKGEYTVDYEAGTYYGCVRDSGCIFLGREKKVGLSTWRNGEYTYSINEITVQVYKKGKVIFQDNIGS